MNFVFGFCLPLGHVGGALGAQMEAKAFKKALQKNIKKMMPKMTPNWSQRGSQNRAKIIKNDVLEATCFKDGSQVASRPLPGSILERFWDHFGTIFVSFSNIVFVIFHAFCSSTLQTKTCFSRSHVFCVTLSSLVELTCFVSPSPRNG